MVGQLLIIDRTGHTPVEWDTADPESVEKVVKEFNERVNRYGARAFDTTKKPGEPIEVFDPEAQSEVTIVPQFAGG